MTLILLAMIRRRTRRDSKSAGRRESQLTIHENVVLRYRAWTPFKRIEYMEGSAKPGNSSHPLPVPIPRQAIQNERRDGKKALTQVRHNKQADADNADNNDVACLSRTPQPSSLERLPSSRGKKRA
ncbi:phosphatidylethanolamine N-methyltransferase [Aspergillus niger]